MRKDGNPASPQCWLILVENIGTYSSPFIEIILHKYATKIKTNFLSTHVYVVYSRFGCCFVCKQNKPKQSAFLNCLVCVCSKNRTHVSWFLGNCILLSNGHHLVRQLVQLCTIKTVSSPLFNVAINFQTLP